MATARVSMVMLGSLIHAFIVLVTCFAVPLAMDSNIWPIAGVFWSLLAVPVAAATGAMIGLLGKRLPWAIALPILFLTAAILATAVGIIISHNR